MAPHELRARTFLLTGLFTVGSSTLTFAAHAQTAVSPPQPAGANTAASRTTSQAPSSSRAPSASPGPGHAGTSASPTGGMSSASPCPTIVPSDALVSAATQTDAANGIDESTLFARWLRSGAEVASWRTQIGAARFDIVTARIWPNPSVAVNTLITLAGTPPDGQYNIGGQITFPLPIFGQIATRIESAERALSVAEVQVVEMLWDRAGDIQTAMIDRAFADARIQMLRRNFEEMALIERVIEARLAAGANSRYDLLRVQTSSATIRAGIEAATIARARAEAHLLSLINDTSLHAAPITRTGLANFRGPENEAQLLEVARRGRPDLELARRGIVASAAVAQRWRVDAVPTPSVWVGGYFSMQPGSGSIQAGISLPLPVFDRNQGLIGRALLEQRGHELLASALDARVHEEVSGAWNARVEARRALDEFRNGGLAATTELLRRAESSYREGAFTVMDLLDAYRSVWDARAQELDLEREAADSEAELERAAALITFR